jgi:hypothetical protein
VLEGAVTKLSLSQFLINHTFGALPRSLRSLTLNTAACREGSICIQELDSHTFLPTILNNKKVKTNVLYFNQSIKINNIF